jgi:hypothetical protein
MPPGFLRGIFIFMDAVVVEATALLDVEVVLAT